jgi:O-acetyl-ADP-ribose deacetylase (regulator of RNase III)
MRLPMTLENTLNAFLAVRATLLLIKYGKFDDGTPISDKVKTVAFPGMGTGVGGLNPIIFAKQMRWAIEEVNMKKMSFQQLG